MTDASDAARVGDEPRETAVPPSTSHAGRDGRVAVTIVAGVLGLLVVAQLRSQAASPGLAGLSAQDLTSVVANLDTRNDQLRSEVASLERQFTDLGATQGRGAGAVEQLRSDLRRVQVWSGVLAVSGPGVAVAISGPIAGDSAMDVVNELWSAGAEAIAVGEVRIVPGSVIAGVPGEISIENTSLGTTFEIRAIGSPQTLAGSLTRLGGVVAQLAATHPEIGVTVTPLDRLELPATLRSLRPGHGQPVL